MEDKEKQRLDPATAGLIVSTELKTTVLRSLLPASYGLGILSAVMCVAHLLLQPRGATWKAAIPAAVTAVALLTLAVHLHRRIVPIGYAHRIAAGVALLVFANLAGLVWLSRDAFLMAYLMVFLISTGYFLLSTPWFVTIAVLVNATWFVGILTLPLPTTQLHAGFTAALTTIIATLVHLARRRTLGRLEGLRLQAEHQRAELQATLQTLQRSEENYRGLAENASDLIQSVLPDGTLQYVNRAWLESLGYSPEEIPHLSVYDVVHPDSHNACRAIFENSTEGPRAWRLETTFLTKDGQEVLVEGSINTSSLRETPQATRGIFRDITARKQMEDLLTEERDLTEAILGSAGVLIVATDAEGRIVRFNQACEELSGYPFTEAKGRHVWSLFDLPDEVATVRKAFLETQAGTTPRAYESHWLNTQGERRLIEWSNTALLNQDGSIKSVIASGIDVTARSNAEHEVAERRSYLEGVLAATPDAIVTLDGEHRILEWNAGAERLFGYPRDEVVGQYIDPYITNRESREEAVALTQRAIHGLEILPLETVRFRKDGTPVNVILAASPIWVGDDLAGAVAVYTDITALKQAEEDLQQRNADLDAFSHTVAHDLKGPLSNIYGFATLLRESLSPDAEEVLHEGINVIARSAQRMVNIIDALLLLAGIRGSRVETETVSMGPVVEEVLHRLAYMIRAYNAQVIQPEAWPVCVGYAAWIGEIWANYISNALKYGGTPPIVELGADPLPDGMIRFWVRDNGEGMTQEQQAQLFTPFTRLSQIRVEGHGLGLSIVRRIMDRLGGRVGVNSAPDQGSEFYFCLPALSSEPRSPR